MARSRHRAGVDQKFDLGTLSQFKDKTVDDVIKGSVAEYLERSTFNRVEDVTILLECLTLDPEPIRSYFPKLKELMKRRHALVHGFDQSGAAPIQNIDAMTVLDWGGIVVEVTLEILMQAVTKHIRTRTAKEVIKLLKLDITVLTDTPDDLPNQPYKQAYCPARQQRHQQAQFNSASHA
ncbi:MAG: hypothetical protein ABI830_05725 [Pseudolabrys sp.]